MRPEWRRFEWASILPARQNLRFVKDFSHLNIDLSGSSKLPSVSSKFSIVSNFEQTKIRLLLTYLF